MVVFPNLRTRLWLHPFTFQVADQAASSAENSRIITGNDSLVIRILEALGLPCDRVCSLDVSVRPDKPVTVWTEQMLIEQQVAGVEVELKRKKYMLREVTEESDAQDSPMIEQSAPPSDNAPQN